MVYYRNTEEFDVLFSSVILIFSQNIFILKITILFVVIYEKIDNIIILYTYVYYKEKRKEKLTCWIQINSKLMSTEITIHVTAHIPKRFFFKCLLSNFMLPVKFTWNYML